MRGMGHGLADAKRPIACYFGLPPPFFGNGMTVAVGLLCACLYAETFDFTLVREDLGFLSLDFDIGSFGCAGLTLDRNVMLRPLCRQGLLSRIGHAAVTTSVMPWYV